MSSAHTERLRETVAAFPGSPGVYLMKSGKGRVIYVGKAKNLAARVRNYLQKPETLDPKTNALMRSAREIDYIATGSEVEALVLECTLIKEHRPRYNVRLKDDKRYPYLKLTVREPFPRLLLVRRLARDGAEYFGPFTDARALRRTMRTIRTIFPLRDCGAGRMGRGTGRACLNFHIGRCRGPCVGSVSQADYAELVRQVGLFLRGKSRRLEETLRDRMWRLSREKRYEEAAAVRDQLQALVHVTERRNPVSARANNEDFLAVAREGTLSCGVVMTVREGAIHSKESFFIPSSRNDTDRGIFDAFFELYYDSTEDVPPRVYTQHSLEDAELLADWLETKRGGRVAIAVPRRGGKRSLLDLALTNAHFQLATAARAKRQPAPALLELKTALGLSTTPGRIEAYDISNIQGSEAVGALVCFEKGVPFKSGYRHFKIRDVRGADDYAMMREVLGRRLGRLTESSARPPDLILVDGGKGQVSAAREALDALGVAGIPVIGLAKRHEEIYLEGREAPLRLPRRNPALRLLQRMRNEAHRFAIEYHRKLRSARMRRSGLEDIPGIGPTRAAALLAEFGSVDGLRGASLDEIVRVPGMGESVAKKVFGHLHGK